MMAAATVNTRVVGSGPPLQVSRSFAGFCRAIVDSKSNYTNRVAKGNHELANVYKTKYVRRPGVVSKSAMSESSGSTGGYIVPKDYTAALLKSFGEKSIIYQRSRIVGMQSATTQCPVVDTTTAQSAGTAPYWGGALFSWGFEDAPTETEMAFRQVGLTAWDLIGYSVVSNEFLQDTEEPFMLNGTMDDQSGEEKMVEELGKAAAWYADYAFINGTGTAFKMPLGVINAPCTIGATRDSSGHITATTVGAMAASLLPYCWENAIWIAHPTCLADIVKLSTYSLNNGNVAHPAACGALLTRPLFISDKLPALGTKGDIILMDPSMYAVGLRQEVLIDVSADVPTLFTKYQTAFRVWMRCDGKPILDNQVTMADGSTKGSSIVVVVT